MATAQDVIEYLTEVDWPASKDQLVEAAQQAGAPEDVVKALRGMPPVDYADKGEVKRSAHTEP